MLAERWTLNTFHKKNPLVFVFYFFKCIIFKHLYLFILYFVCVLNQH